MTMRSKGNSKTIGAAIAPTAALASLTGQPCDLATMRMVTKMITAQAPVTGRMGYGGRRCSRWCWRIALTYWEAQARNAVMASSQAITMIPVAVSPGRGRRTGRRSRVPAYTTPAATATSTIARSILAVPL